MQDNAKVTPEALKIIMQLLSSNCKVANIKSALLAKGITPDLTSLKREKKVLKKLSFVIISKLFLKNLRIFEFQKKILLWFVVCQKMII